MNCKAIVTIISILVILLINSQLKAQTANKSLYEVEKLFAKAMQTKGIKIGWLEFLDTACIRFNKLNEPENAYKFWQINDRQGTFDWTAQITEISSSGNFGYTTGPIAYYKTLNTADTPAFYGGYISIWRKNSSGEWKTILDIGTGYPVKTVHVTNPIELQVRSEKDFNAYPKEKSILTIDNKFSVQKRRHSTVTYTKYIGNNFLLFKEGGRVITNKDSLKKYTNSLPLKYYEKVWGFELSDANDLIYVFGSVEMNDEKLHGIYLRIWRKEKKNWKLALEYMRQ